MNGTEIIVLQSLLDIAEKSKPAMRLAALEFIKERVGQEQNSETSWARTDRIDKEIQQIKSQLKEI
jgi:hypothetical protein